MFGGAIYSEKSFFYKEYKRVYVTIQSEGGGIN